MGRYCAANVGCVHSMPRATVVYRNVFRQKVPVAKHAFEHRHVARDYNVEVVVVWYHTECVIVRTTQGNLPVPTIWPLGAVQWGYAHYH